MSKFLALVGMAGATVSLSLYSEPIQWLSIVNGFTFGVAFATICVALTTEWNS